MIWYIVLIHFILKQIGGLKTDELVPQEFQGVVTLEGDEELVSDANKVPLRTQEVLSSCHALVFVDNKLVSCVDQANN
jgi:manganese-transporting P-type ATPase